MENYHHLDRPITNARMVYTIPRGPKKNTLATILARPASVLNPLAKQKVEVLRGCRRVFFWFKFKQVYWPQKFVLLRLTVGRL